MLPASGKVNSPFGKPVPKRHKTKCLIVGMHILRSLKHAEPVETHEDMPGERIQQSRLIRFDRYKLLPQISEWRLGSQESVPD